MSRVRSGAARVVRVAGVGVVIVLALVVILTALRTEPPRSPGVMTDALGPESGEPVDRYLEHAAATISGAAGPDDAPRWALVSAGSALTIGAAADAVRDLPRVSGLYAQVPVDGVAMPVSAATLVEPAAGETGREAVFTRALGGIVTRLESEPTASGRPSAKAALTASRIRDGAPAIIAMVARGDTGQLRAVAAHPGVRAVEALPADAVWNHFAVRPLLPQQVDVADPLPDDAPVPPP